MSAAACARTEDGEQGAVQDTAAAVAPAPATAGPSDAEIAHIVVTANSIDIDVGEVADRAYITNEVNYHQQVLDAIDNTLIPNAQNADLKALLEQSRPAFAAHLDMAKKIQASLGQ